MTFAGTHSPILHADRYSFRAERHDALQGRNWRENSNRDSRIAEQTHQLLILLSRKYSAMDDNYAEISAQIPICYLD